MGAALLKPKGAATLQFGLRRRSTGRWQFCLRQGEKFIINWTGGFRGPNGENNALDAIELVRSTDGETVIRRYLSY